MSSKPTCDICLEEERCVIEGVRVIIEYTDPLAYGYPEIVHWTEQYALLVCPFCGRALKNLKEVNVKRKYRKD